MSNYTILHLHTEKSSAFTTLDSVTSYQDYIDKAKECGMKSIAFTEHSNVLGWIDKKKYAEKQGLKYIHGVEAYITEDKMDEESEDRTYDNYHIILLARNYKAVKEINKLLSQASVRRDVYTYADISKIPNYYYQPRINYEVLKNTSDDIIITSACLGGILNNGSDKLQKDFIQFMTKNKHRCFLEIQHHLVTDQINYNKKLLDISNRTGIRLVMGTDTHSLNDNHAIGRDILQKSKNIHFKNEDDWDLVFKTYEELINSCKEQNAIPMNEYLKAIENTNIIANMVEEFDFDYSFKYPDIHECPKTELSKLIKEGIKWRKYDLSAEIKDRIAYELQVFENNQMLDFMLLDADVKRWCRENYIEYGESRGSISGSLVAYLIGITHIDPIKYNLVFERFVHNERVGLADIDSDYNPKDIPAIKEYLYGKHNLYCADVVTYNTIALKGSIRDVGRALDISLDTINTICNNIETNEDKYRSKYPELFRYVDLLRGTMTSIGSHPGAVCIADEDLASTLGVFYTATNKYPVLQVDMREIESLNYLKLDILKLDTIGIINDTCKAANIDRLRDWNTNYNDIDVWNSMLDSTAMIFQWNGYSGETYYRQLFSYENRKRLQEEVGKIDYVNLFSIGNAAIRPSGDSYREDLAKGIIPDYHNEQLNNFFEPTFRFVVYQEDIQNFLYEFCGFTLGQADMVRRGLAKKSGTEEFIPSIKEGFIKTMEERYGMCEKESDKTVTSFLNVILDASAYAFSKNHSDAYSIIGYQTAYLRYHHTLEFITSNLNYADTKEKMSEILQYMNKFTNITLNPIKFGYSGAEYRFDRATNSIYKGIASIKFLNIQIGEELKELGKNKNKYLNFLDLLYDIKDKTSCNTRELDILIQLDFFSEFGKSQKLLDFVPYFNAIYKAKVINKEKFEKLNHIISKYSRETEKQYRDIDNYKILEEIWNSIPNKEISIAEKLKAQTDYLGYIDYANPKIDKKYILVTKLDTKYSPKFIGYCLNNGKTQELKVYKQKKGRGMPGVKTYFKNSPFKNGDLLYTKKFKDNVKSRKTENGFEKIPNTQEWWLVDYKVVNNDVVDCIINK